MNSDVLNKFEWHDLPLSALTITESGVELIVTPYSEDSADYERYRLVLGNASVVRFDVQGSLRSKGFQELAVSYFRFDDVGDSRLSGELGILPSSGVGFWTVVFENARWQFSQLPAEDAAAHG